MTAIELIWFLLFGLTGYSLGWLLSQFVGSFGWLIGVPLGFIGSFFLSVRVFEMAGKRAKLRRKRERQQARAEAAKPDSKVR